MPLSVMHKQRFVRGTSPLFETLPVVSVKRLIRKGKYPAGSDFQQASRFQVERASGGPRPLFTKFSTALSCREIPIAGLVVFRKSSSAFSSIGRDLNADLQILASFFQPLLYIHEVVIHRLFEFGKTCGKQRLHRAAADVSP